MSKLPTAHHSTRQIGGNVGCVLRACSRSSRAAFASAVEAYLKWEQGQREPTVELDTPIGPVCITLSVACGQVWNCMKTVPDHLAITLESLGFELKQHTYSECAHVLHAAIKAERQPALAMADWSY